MEKLKKDIAYLLHEIVQTISNGSYDDLTIKMHHDHIYEMLEGEENKK